MVVSFLLLHHSVPLVPEYLCGGPADWLYHLKMPLESVYTCTCSIMLTLLFVDGAASTGFGALRIRVLSWSLLDCPLLPVGWSVPAVEVVFLGFGELVWGYFFQFPPL